MHLHVDATVEKITLHIPHRIHATLLFVQAALCYVCTGMLHEALSPVIPW